MKNFEAWKTEVLRYIRFFPDRGAIARELEDHYEDGVTDLLRIGYAEDLARERLGLVAPNDRVFFIAD